MSAVGRGVRLAVAAAILGIVLAAQLDRHDDWFPLGMLGQYAVARDPDGEVVNTYLVGVDAKGRQVPITLRAETAGLTRVELELALGRGLREDPAPLGAVARTYEDNHPGTDLVALEVRQRVDTLRGGSRVGPPTDRLVLRWEDTP
ncbi:hypothetical protein [Ornithinimicrobium flavum]|uniref:hypothetical protein n=1 Tax=Ornithinimicrobium flavum TaxID=1288636 RepID=UPI0010700A3B|nr:hypothetical protein [Ornithinimicrobium flavum]